MTPALASFFVAPQVGRLAHVAWASDGRHFAALGEDGDVDVYAAESGRICAQVRGEGDFFEEVTGRPDKLAAWLERGGERLIAARRGGHLAEARSATGSWRDVSRSPFEGEGYLAVDEKSGRVAHACMRHPIHAGEPSLLRLLAPGPRSRARETEVEPGSRLLAMAFVDGELRVALGEDLGARVVSFSDTLERRRAFRLEPRAFGLARFSRLELLPGGTVAFLGVRTEEDADAENVAGLITLPGTLRLARAFPLLDHSGISCPGNTELVFVPGGAPGESGALVVGHERHFVGIYPARVHVFGGASASPGPDVDLALPRAAHVAIDPSGRRAVALATRAEASSLVELPSGKSLFSLDPRQGAKAAVAGNLRAARVHVDERFLDAWHALAAAVLDAREGSAEQGAALSALADHLTRAGGEPFATIASLVRREARAGASLGREELRTRLDAFYDDASRWGLKAGVSGPLLELAPRGAYHRLRSGFFGWELLPHVQALTLVSDELCCRHGFANPKARRLAASPALRRLLSLRFSGAGLGPSGAIALAASETLSGLRALHFRWEGVGARGARAIARSPTLGRLRALSLDRSLGGRPALALEALGGAVFAGRLRFLSLRGNLLGAGDLGPLVGSPLMRDLERLELGPLEHPNPLGDEGARLLAASPEAASLRHLGLRGCGIGAKGALALASSPHLERLERLDLEDNPVPASVRRALSRRFGLRLRLGPAPKGAPLPLG